MFSICARSQTLTISPGLTLVASNAVDFPDAEFQSGSKVGTFSVYDVADLSGFVTTTNAVEIYPVGAPRPAPKVTTDLTPVIGPVTVPTNSVVIVHGRHYTNGIAIYYRGTETKTVTLSR